MSDIATLAQGLGLSDEQLEQLTKNLSTLTSAKLLEIDSEIARAKEGLRITNNGLDMLAKANAGQKLTFTRVELGDAVKSGKIISPTAEEILTYSKLIHKRDIDLPLADCRFVGGGCSVVKFQLSNAQLEEGFWAREVGLYAKVEGETEKLYAYKNNGNLSTWIPASDGATAMNLIISLVTVIDQATNVTAVVDANLLFTTEAEFIEHVTSPKPHPNIPNVSTEIYTTNYIWVTGDDRQLHPISAKNLQTQLLGSSLYELPHLSNRLTQTEINLSNLYTQLGSLVENNLDANLLLAEDFSDGDAIDQFSVKVDHAMAGADLICVESLDGILEGHYYTISDGVKSQYVRVRAVSRNDDVLSVLLDSVMKYTLNLPKTYLYRSTGLVTKGSASGSGDVRDKLCTFGEVWQGALAGQAAVKKLVTTAAKKNSFTLSGDWDFTTDSFTIKS